MLTACYLEFLKNKIYHSEQKRRGKRKKIWTRPAPKSHPFVFQPDRRPRGYVSGTTFVDCSLLGRVMLESAPVVASVRLCWCCSSPVSKNHPERSHRAKRQQQRQPTPSVHVNVFPSCVWDFVMSHLSHLTILSKGPTAHSATLRYAISPAYCVWYFVPCALQQGCSRRRGMDERTLINNLDK